MRTVVALRRLSYYQTYETFRLARYLS